MNRSFKWAVAATTVGVLVVGFVGGRAWAGGIPTKGALTYSGILQRPDGSPLQSSGHNLEIKLWSTGPTGGTQLCDTTVLAPDFKLDDSGRFSVQLEEPCTGAVAGNAGAFVEIILDGSPLGPRTKLGAVPYAIEANHASSADSATGLLAQQVVPAGAVMAFDLDACPLGWSSMADAAGRTVIGATVGLVRGTKAGSDQVTLTPNQMPSHSHAVTDPGHAHGPSDANTFITAGGTGTAHVAWGDVFNITAVTSKAVTGITLGSTGGGQPFDNRQASLALLYCRKN